MATSFIPGMGSGALRNIETASQGEGAVIERQPLNKWLLAQKVSLSFLSSLPAALVALPAAYGSAMFSQTVYQPPWNGAIGIGVESCYIGLILFARTKSRKTFVMTALAALLCSVIYNTLHAAEIKGLLASQAWPVEWLLALLHGSPLPLLGFSYFMLLHSSSDDAARSSGSLRARPRTIHEDASPKSKTEPEISKSGSTSSPIYHSADNSGKRFNVETEEAEKDSESEKAAYNPGNKTGSFSQINLLRPLTPTTATIPITSETAQQIPPAKTEIGSSPTDLASFAKSLARQVQSGKLGVGAFEQRLEEWRHQASLSELDEPGWPDNMVLAELKKLIRQVQKREMKVREFDQIAHSLLRRD